MSISSDITKVNELLNRHYYKGSLNDYATKSDGTTCFKVSDDAYVDTEAYAYYDTSDTSLNFIRLEKNKYNNGQVVGSKTYYKGVESIAAAAPTDIPWTSRVANITTVNFIGEIQPVSTAYWFDGCKNLATINNLDRLDTSKCTSFAHMFEGCAKLGSVIMTAHNTAAVTDMSYMFSGCTALYNCVLTNFNTAAVTNMSYMFDSCMTLASLDVSMFDTSNVTTFAGMFSECYDLATLTLGNFITSNATSMALMFNLCTSLTSLSLTSFDTSKVTTMRQMFYACRACTSFDLTSFNTSRVTDMYQMFSGCNALTTLSLPTVMPIAATTVEGMFADCIGLVSLDLRSWEFKFDATSVSANNLFSGCSSLEHIYVSSLWDVSKISSATDVFTDDKLLPNYDATDVTGAKAHTGENGYLELR